jgi:hypothetical protein
MAHEAISRMVLATNDSLFSLGKVASDMYFADEGSLFYFKVSLVREDNEDSTQGQFSLQECEPEEIDPQSNWISEAVLWTKQWRHLGDLVAEDYSELIVVSGHGFEGVVKTCAHSCRLARKYATCFLEWLNDKEPQELSDIYDRNHGASHDFLMATGGADSIFTAGPLF